MVFAGLGFGLIQEVHVTMSCVAGCIWAVGIRSHPSARILSTAT